MKKINTSYINEIICIEITKTRINYEIMGSTKI